MATAATPTEAPPQTAFQQARAEAAAEALPGAFMKAEDREEFYAEKTPFWVVKAGTQSGKFGDQTHFVLLTDPSQAENGEYDSQVAKVLALDYSAFRDKLAGKLMGIIAKEGIVGPLYLTKFATTSGHDAWDLTDEVPGDGIPY